jgi:hypothetical protein
VDLFRPFDPPGAPFKLFRASIWHLLPVPLLTFVGMWLGSQFFRVIERRDFAWYSLIGCVVFALLNAWLMSRAGSVKVNAGGLYIRPKFLNELFVPWQAIKSAEFKSSTLFSRFEITAATEAPKGFPELSEKIVVDETYSFPAKLDPKRDFVESVAKFAGRDHPLTAALRNHHASNVA